MDAMEEARNFYFLEPCDTTSNEGANNLDYKILDGDFGASGVSEEDLSYLSSICWFNIFDYGFFCDWLLLDEDYGDYGDYGDEDTY